MSDKNIQLRNKFVLKINKNVQKLTRDINLLVQVDKSINNLSGGGKIQDAIKILAAHNATPGAIHNLTAEAQVLTDDLNSKIITLGDSLTDLIAHIKNIKSTEGDLSSIKDALAKLDKTYDISILENIYKLQQKYSTLPLLDQATFDADLEVKKISSELLPYLKLMINLVSASKVKLV